MRRIRRNRRRPKAIKQRRVAYRNASEFAKKLKRYSLIDKRYVYVYEEQKRKEEK